MWRNGAQGTSGRLLVGCRLGLLAKSGDLSTARCREGLLLAIFRSHAISAGEIPRTRTRVTSHESEAQCGFMPGASTVHRARRDHASY